MQWGDIGEQGKTSTTYTETLETDVERLKIELDNTCRERNELKAENAQLKDDLENLRPYSHETVTAIVRERDRLEELLRRAWDELEMRAIEPDLTDEIEQAL
jgi:cell division protein FtsB